MEQLKKAFEKKVSTIKEKEAELQNLREILNEQRQEISSFGKEINRLEEPGGTGKFITRSGAGWSSNLGEKTHVIKVLEHESKIFNF